jgi:tetratricopeptide (TPR) repeat protein
MMTDEPGELDEATRQLRHDPARSLGICERYVSAHPDDADGLFSRFQALRRLGEYERALADINRVLELDPNCAGYSSRGDLFHGVGDYRRGIEDLTHARELNEWEWKTSFDPHMRADCYARLGRLDEALADCEFISDDHWMPAGVRGLPGGNKQEFIAEIRRRAALARRGKA